MKIKELVDWSTLSDDQKKPYQEKVYKLLDIIESVDTEGISILTGSNGGGKSMIRQQFSLKYKKDKIRNPNERKCKSISMQLRTSSNPAFGALSSAMMDNEASPTSLNTFNLIQGVFQASGLYKEVKEDEVRALSETGYIILDEPEIGMAEETVMALVLWLFKHIGLLKREKIGLMIITHSRLLVDRFLGHSIENDYPLDFYNLDNLSIEEYVDKNRIIIPTDLELLKTNYMFNVINDRMDEKEKQNKGEKMKDKLKLLGISFVNVVVKNNNFNKFFDVLKEHEFDLAEDYKIVLQAQVDYLVRNDPAIKNGEVPLFTIPVNLEEKTFIINMDEESFESLDDSYNSLSLEVESFIELLGL